MPASGSINWKPNQAPMNELEMSEIDARSKFTSTGHERMDSGMEIGRLTSMFHAGNEVRKLI
jgi:hypothetical protein